MGPTATAIREAPADLTARQGRPAWRDQLEPYERPSWAWAIFDLLTSIGCLVPLTVAMYMTLGQVPIWVTLLGIPLASGFLLRTFIVFHDCGHGSFTPSRTANLWIGRLAALITFQSYSSWKHAHAVHHGTAGDLERRGDGDVPTLTVSEYLERDWKGRLGYRLFRNPLIMFGIGPIWSLMVGPRIWSKKMRPRSRRSVIVTNLVLLPLVALNIYLVGIGPYLLVQLAPIFLAGVIGVLMFYVQHQFEDVYWEHSDDWDYTLAALKGSSFVDLPQPLQFFTGNIGIHHVHHLSAKVPNYRLQRAHDENEFFHQVPALKLSDVLKAPRLKLIDERTGQLIGWRELRALQA